MSVPAAQHAGTTERQRISIKMTEASAAEQCCHPQLTHTRDVSKARQCGEIALYVFRTSCFRQDFYVARRDSE